MKSIPQSFSELKKRFWIGLSASKKIEIQTTLQWNVLASARKATHTLGLQ